jgi:hypothetical protein
MSITATLVYTVQVLGASKGDIANALAAVALPIDTLAAFGVKVNSDSTAAGPPVTRTIVLGLVPTVDASATIVRFPGSSRSPVESVALGLHGSGYVFQPDIVIGYAVDATGRPPGFGATAVCFLDVLSIGLAGPGDSTGTLYAVPPPVTIVGGLSPKGVAATAHATVAAGSLTGIVVDTPGSGYVSLPFVKIGPPGVGGTQAHATASMEVGELILLGGGQEYLGPTIFFRPRFKGMFPDAHPFSQAAPFRQLFTTIIGRQLCCPVVASAPLIA